MVTVNQRHSNELEKEGFDFDNWLKHMEVQYSTSDLDELRHIYEMMNGVVEHQQLIFGHSELYRALKTAEILAELKLDINTLKATLIHALVLSSVLTQEQVEIDYGENIALLVAGIEKMNVIDAHHVHSAQNGDKQHVESVRKLLLALAEDVRVVLVKLAERLYMMRNLAQISSEEVRQQIAGETKDIFAPLANRMGIWQIKWELEDLSFRYLQPESYKYVASMLDERRIDREQFIARVTAQINEQLVVAGITGAEVNGRPKHIYSIWKKMQRKGVSFHDLFDIRATRVMVDSVTQCYTVLGIVHSLWIPIKSEFDDYIAVPKKNNYQSLHTAVIGPENQTLEIQIRTREMHLHSEYGVAAHWGYKEGTKHDAKFNEKIAWLRQLLEWKDDTNEGEFLDRFKSEVFEDRVYALTPKGNVIDLPKGATTLDFAYHIHSEVGNRYRGAKVDGKIVTLGYQLKNGQKVEILTSKLSTPSRDWLNPHLGYIGSSRTRAKVRNWFKQQDYSQNIIDGRALLERELHRLGINNVDYDYLQHRFKVETNDELFVAIGRGDISHAQIANAVNELILPQSEPTKSHHLHDQNNELSKIGYLRPRSLSHDHDGVQIMGVGDLVTKLAMCCKPVPYDNIMGYITRGRGVTVHRQDCPNLLRLQVQEKERLIDVGWGSHDSVRTYPVEIDIQAFDRQGLLRDITDILTNSLLNVISINTGTDKKTNTATMALLVEVQDANQLSRVLSKIEQLPNIMKVMRKHA